MSVDAWITVGVVIALLVGLVRNLAPPDLLFVGGTAFLSVMGIITPDQAFAGFANPGMLTVAFLFVVVAALRETGVLDYVGHHVLGKAQTERAALVRLSFFIVPMSAMLNNTPIVAMFIPIVIDWCRRWRISPAKLLIPLSFLTILGGTCTLIGTSTTLVINGLMIDNGMAGMGLFEIGKVGLPYAIVGSLFLLVFGRRLLPERKELMEQLQESRRDYMVEMRIQSGCRLSGKSVEGAGLRQLPGLYLIEIEREGQVIAPVRPDDVLQALDRLVLRSLRAKGATTGDWLRRLSPRAPRSMASAFAMRTFAPCMVRQLSPCIASENGSNKKSGTLNYALAIRCCCKRLRISYALIATIPTSIWSAKSTSGGPFAAIVAGYRWAYSCC